MKRRIPVESPVGPAEPIPIALYGLGAIGCEVARLALGKRSLKVVAAVDTDPAKLGKDLAEVAGLPSPTGIPITANARAAKAAGAQVVIHSTQSFFPDVVGQLRSLAEAGLNVVSSSEELSYPFLKYRAHAEDLDQLARDRGVRLLGTGVNPGFVMDTLPLLATAVCQQMSRLRIERVVDASLRRYNLQKKIGAGMSVEQFEAEMASGRMGHIGLVESVAMVAAGLGWKLDRIEEEILPVVAEAPTRSDYFDLAPGAVAGLRQTAIGYRGDEELITLYLEMALGATDPRDRVRIAGRPAMTLDVPGGTHGDVATAAVLANAVPRLLEAPPGLRTMLDLPLPRYID
ncbi:MAG TPA: hypothetical protein V6D05_08410 [Stenomitos sp.]